MTASSLPSRPLAAAAPTFGAACRTWARIGLLSFGGPTAQIALMHRIVVEDKRWLDERAFLNALGFCMLLPGPEAMQLATYVGWRLHGTAGGLAAGLLFVLPGAVVVLALAAVYAVYGHVPLVAAIFFGIKAAVLVIVVEALQRIARRALGTRLAWMIAATSFVAIFLLALPFPLIVLSAGLLGLWLPAGTRANPGSTDAAPASPVAPSPEVPLTQTLRTIVVWLAVWALPLLAVGLAVGREHVLTRLAVFFSKLAVVTFGGAYAVLAYMAQDVVTRHAWLEPGQMLDGLGLAETTPGPLILVTEFVGFLAAFRHGGGPALPMGLAGAGIALWATFAPCFLWIFAGAPFVERLGRQPRLAGALAAITAAVVGVILNLAVWFALHVFFRHVDHVAAGPFALWVPDPSSLDWRLVMLAGVSGWLLLKRHWSIAAVLTFTAATGLALTALLPP